MPKANISISSAAGMVALKYIKLTSQLVKLNNSLKDNTIMSKLRSVAIK